VNKGLAWLVPGTELNLTNSHQQSATKRSGSVHKTNCKCRTVTVPQVSLWKHQYCAAITGCVTEVGENETPAQITWTSLAVTNVPSTCGGLWVSTVSQTGVTSTKGAWNIRWDLFPMVKRQGRETDFLHILSWWKKRGGHIHYPASLSTFNPIPKTRQMMSSSTYY